MKKAYPVPLFRKTSSKDDKKRIANIERRIFHLEKRMTRLEESRKDKPKMSDKQLFGRKDSDSDEKTDTYSDLEESSDSNSQSDLDTEENDDYFVSNEFWNMRPGEKLKTMNHINDHMDDFIRSISNFHRQNGMTLDQIRRRMEQFFDVKLTNRSIGGIKNFRSKFDYQIVHVKRLRFQIYFPKKQQE